MANGMENARMKRPPETTGTTAEDSRSVRALWITIWLLSVVWLPFAVLPIVQAVGLQPPLRAAPLLAGAALFIGLYLWATGQDASYLARATPTALRPRWQTWLPIAALTLLASALVLGAGADWLGMFIFVCAAAGRRLPVAHAVWVIALLIPLALATGLLGHAPWDNILQTIVLITTVGVTVVGACWAFVTNRELRIARRELARLAVTEERLRFARDLHDLLGHTLSLIALKSELAGRMVRPAPERAIAEIGDIEAASRTALQEVREAVSGYRQPTLASELHAARELLAAAGVALTVDGEIPRVTPGAEAALSWMVREGVTNVIRHSRARHCTIRITQPSGSIAVEICDDGRGHHTSLEAPDDGQRGGSGLCGLAERVAAQGGTFAAGPLVKGGFRLAVSLPSEPGELVEPVEPGATVEHVTQASAPPVAPASGRPQAHIRDVSDGERVEAS